MNLITLYHARCWTILPSWTCAPVTFTCLHHYWQQNAAGFKSRCWLSYMLTWLMSASIQLSKSAMNKAKTHPFFTHLCEQEKNLTDEQDWLLMFVHYIDDWNKYLQHSTSYIHIFKRSLWFAPTRKTSWRITSLQLTSQVNITHVSGPTNQLHLPDSPDPAFRPIREATP